MLPLSSIKTSFEVVEPASIPRNTFPEYPSNFALGALNLECLFLNSESSAIVLNNGGNAGFSSPL